MIRNTVIVMGKRVAYWERNPHWTQTIVMLHGFRGNHKGLLDLVQHFDGFHLILPDLPGYGESEALDMPHTLINYSRWFDDFVAALELKDYTSWSHSYSGSIAIIHAATGMHRPNAVISVALAAIRRDWASSVSTAYYQIGRLMPPAMQHRWVASKILDRFTGRWLFRTVTADRRKVLMRRGAHNLSQLNARVVTEEYLSALDTNLAKYASRVNVPVLVIGGAKDIIVPMKRLEHLVAMMPDGTLVIMEDQGHLAPIERPATTATLTKRFIHGLDIRAD